MSICEEAEKRRKKIKSLRSKRAKLLNQRHLSMKGRRMSATAQQCLKNVTLAAKEKKEQEPEEVRILVYVR